MDLKVRPFYLTDEDVTWVKDTLAGMTFEEKIGQLFCPIGTSKEEADLKALLDTFHVAGLMFRPDTSEVVREAHRFLQQNSKIPLMLAANLESGGIGLVSDGTLMGAQMQIAATDKPVRAWQLGTVCGREAASVGGNWGFSPVIDIDYNHRNPITNTRTYGSDPKRVVAMGSAYQKAMLENGMAVSIKHFPGDGVDGRDQHLLTSVNTLSCEDWDASYGMIYKTLINEGAQTVMIGHIQMPAYQKRFRPELPEEDYMPATLAPELMGDLLRGKLGFNGVIVSDATSMAGFSQAMKREEAVPACIAAGCDLFLFNMGLEADFDAMVKGVEKGILSMERVDEAITRTLALKASLGLHKKQKAGTLVPAPEAGAILKCEEHLAWAKGVADDSITLVKNKEGLLPLDPKRFKKVLVHVLGDQAAPGSHSGGGSLSDMFIEKLRAEGFDVTRFDPDGLDFTAMFWTVKDHVKDYDLILYYANVGTYSNQTTIRLHWAPPMGINVPKFIQEVPTAFISVAGPYHLEDVPRVKTFINCYTSSENTVNALVEKLMGRSDFRGVSPVDAFCGLWDARL